MDGKRQRQIFGHDPEALAVVAADRLLAMGLERDNARQAARQNRGLSGPGSGVRLAAPWLTPWGSERTWEPAAEPQQATRMVASSHKDAADARHHLTCLPGLGQMPCVILIRSGYASVRLALLRGEREHGLGTI